MAVQAVIGRRAAFFAGLVLLLLSAPQAIAEDTAPAKTGIGAPVWHTAKIAFIRPRGPTLEELPK